MILSKLDISKLNFKNHYKFEDALHRSVVIVFTHPFAYCRILIQLGYEPLRPILVDRLFGGSQYAYPSVFKYLSFIKQEDGIFGLYRGLGYRFCSELTNDCVYVNSLDICEQIDKLQSDEKNEGKVSKEGEESSTDDSKNEQRERARFERESIMKLLKKLCRESISKTIALTLSYPLHVCFIRGCSQFIGREKIYNFNPSNVVAIIKQGNFYDGFMPKLLAELLILWVANSLIFSADALFEPETILLGYLSSFISFLASSTMYPLQLTSTIMAVNHSSCLMASKIEPPFYNWKACYDSLEKRNQLKRGSSMIWRYVANAYKPQAIIRPYLDDK